MSAAAVAAAGEDSFVLPVRALPFLLRYVGRRPWQFGGLFALIVAAVGCAVGVQYAMKLLIDAMGAGARASAPVWPPLLAFLGLIGGENLFWRLGGWLGCRAIVGAGVDLRVELFDHLVGHPMQYFTQHFSGALGNRITVTAKAVEQIFTSLAWGVIPPCTDFLGATVVLCLIHWQMAAALGLFVAATAGVILKIGAAGRGLHQDYAERSSQVGGEVVDVVANVWLLKAFSARRRERERLEQAFGREAGSHRNSWLYTEKTRVVHDTSLWLLAGGMLAWAVWLWRQGMISQGDVVIVSALTFRILHGSRDLAFSLLKTAEHFGTVAESLRVIARPHELRDAPGAPELQPRGGAIRLEQVDFAYPDGRTVFRGFNFDIAAGSSLGIVGPSGGGKSTLLALIQRLYDVQGGRILIDGQDLRGVSQDSLRQSIAVVPQEVALLRRTILDNIRYGLPGAGDEEVLAAACAACCDEFVQELPRGYQTLVGERGIMLSGGQRQRIGLARALLKNAPILILDEGTSALDTQSEALIQSAMSRLMTGRTVLAVAHRLSTIASFDRVIVLDDGRVIEDGAPQALLGRNGVFRRLWDLQLRTDGGSAPRRSSPDRREQPQSGRWSAAGASRVRS